jgi:transposase
VGVDLIQAPQGDRGSQDHHDRRDLPEGAPHGIQPAGKKGDFRRLIGRPKGGMNTKLHAVTDANARPLSFLMTAGQVSDYTGAAALLDELPKAQWLLGDRDYDADWFRDAQEAKGIQPCIPGRKSRNEPVRYDKPRYRRRSRITIMFGRLKDWRRAATRYDRCPTVFFSAVALAATVIFSYHQ